MIDTYTMILWAKANDNKLEIQTNQVYRILSILNQTSYLKPRYLTAYKKKNVKEFELTIDNVKKLIIKKRDKQFTELGSRFSFFTSLDDEESVGISISTGVSKPGFQNNIVIELNTDYKERKIEEFERLADIFKQLVVVSEPFYGCIASGSNYSLFGTYYNKNTNLPASIFDVNYWGEEIINNLSIHQIMDRVYECEKIGRGYYIRLQKDVIDTFNINHMRLQKNINDSLGIGDKTGKSNRKNG